MPYSTHHSTNSFILNRNTVTQCVCVWERENVFLEWDSEQYVFDYDMTILLYCCEICAADARFKVGDYA